VHAFYDILKSSRDPFFTRYFSQAAMVHTCIKKEASDGFKLITQAGDMSLRQLENELMVLRRSCRPLQLKCVALQGSAEHVIKWMFVLDGFAKDIVLVPQVSCARFIFNICEKVSVDEVVTDSTVDSSNWPDDVSVHVPGSQQHDSNFPVQSSKTVCTRWLVVTSGTTGTGKIVSHTFKSLTRTIAKDFRQRDLVWGLMYDPCRFAGLQVMLNAVINGVPLAVTDAADSIEKRTEFLTETGVSAMSGTPTLWRKILMTEFGPKMRLRQITLGGEAADKGILTALKHKFPYAHITHIYASTEAGVGFSVHDGKEGFPLSWLETAVKGVELAVSPENTLKIRSCAQTQSYVGHSATIFENDGWHDTGDLVEQVDDRMVFRGRLNGSINVGGNKVMPEEVERHIEKLECVAAALVKGRSSSIMGNLLEVSVVLAVPIDKSELKKLVRDHCSAHLAGYKVPRFVKIINEIPATQAGKILRT